MNVLKNPLTIDEIKQYKDKDNYVQGIIPISLHTIIDANLDQFLDNLSESLVNSTALMDVQYAIVGHQDSTTVLISVSGDTSEILADYP